MKISDGNWLIQPNFELKHPAQVYQYHFANNKLTVFAAAQEVLSDRARQINATLFTYEISSPMQDIVEVKLYHHAGVDITALILS